MLYVAYNRTDSEVFQRGEILFRVDAWQSDCEEQANKFIRDGYWVPVKREITFNGDMVIWVD